MGTTKLQFMKTITVYRLPLQFDGDQITHGNPEKQAREAIDLINQILQREPYGFSAQLIAASDESKSKHPSAKRVRGRVGSNAMSVMIILPSSKSSAVMPVKNTAVMNRHRKRRNRRVLN